MDWLKKNSFNAISLLVGILGILSSFYFYTISVKNKEPVVIEKTNIQVFSPSFSDSGRFVLVDNDTGLEVKSGVFFQEMAVWNKGKEIIRKDDILSPIKISYDENVKIIDVSINEATRPNIVKPYFTKDNNTVDLGFSILEHNDGFKVQVVYASSEKAVAKISGDIAGVQEFYTFNDLTFDNIFLGIGKIIMWGFVAILGLVVVGGILHVLTLAIEKIFPEKHDVITKYLGKIVSYLWGGFLVCFVILLIGSQVYRLAQSEASDTVPEMEKTVVQTTNKAFKSDS
ncbi:hypothetical protein LO82_22250 [Vibrio vulnificus]|uniref:hypothetical protein n=1 Tax=Vibrio vulnificus TaxID=672 RepID=UPI0006AD310F|nr:hypothetical protein [Vibrio vulnificus]KOR93824.1 hypothetical protein LO82_22250 [Vibrio vulnificus]HCG8565371.1 hypothetical protein [Vibrio parahaemolyticus]HDY8067682.1 hypothetical protein [Vibrio vulnificus]